MDRPADDHPLEPLRPRGVGGEGGAGHPGHGRPRRGVDDHLRPHRLAARPVDHDDARRFAGRVGQHARRRAAEEVPDAGLQERLVQDALDVHRPDGAEGGARCGGRFAGAEQHHLAHEDALRAGLAREVHPDVADLPADRHARQEGGAGLVRVVHGADLLPGVAVGRGLDRHRAHAEVAAAVEDDGPDLGHLGRLAQVARDSGVAVVLDAVGLGRSEHTVGQAAALGVGVAVGGLEVDGVREGQGPCVGRRDGGGGRVVEEASDQRVGVRRRLVQPQPRRGAYVLAQVRTRGRQEDRGAGPCGLNGGGHGPCRAAHDDHVHVGGERQVAGRLDDRPRLAARGRGRGLNRCRGCAGRGGYGVHQAKAHAKQDDQGGAVHGHRLPKGQGLPRI